MVSALPLLLALLTTGAAAPHLSWRTLHGDSLGNQENGLDAREVARLRKGTTQGDLETVEHGDDVYRRQLHATWNKDQSPVFLARDSEALPTGAGWDYAQASPGEHFDEV